jgi:hypothetical protein
MYLSHSNRDLSKYRKKKGEGERKVEEGKGEKKGKEDSIPRKTSF